MSPTATFTDEEEPHGGLMMKQKRTIAPLTGNAIIIKLGLDKKYNMCKMEFICIMFFIKKKKKISFPVIKRTSKA